MRMRRKIILNIMRITGKTKEQVKKEYKNLLENWGTYWG